MIEGLDSAGGSEEYSRIVELQRRSTQHMHVCKELLPTRVQLGARINFAPVYA